ncbi:MAG: polysaccharide deacetylase family protein [Planctomycetales bacterium]|nr:polysaccharide deacetylase family protein [Planctomycetales bacterium]
MNTMRLRIAQPHVARPQTVARRMFAAWALLLILLACNTGHAATGTNDGNRLTYLDEPVDPYYVGRDSARLTTPQWTGDPKLQAVVVLAIDDMRDPQKYEAYLRPILDRLKQIDGRAGLSIMTNQVAPSDPQLKQWIDEGVSIEIHTTNHPCPLLCENDFAKARQTFDDCVDLMNDIPGNAPVAFRMPCCDSLNTLSPRFFEEIFEEVTPGGHFLEIDSSVFNITTADDPQLTAEITSDESGQQRFQKYLPFPSFVNTIRDYPYPYVIGRGCWEFPCIVPSDWEGNNLHQPNNPQTVTDLKVALDVAVRKQGVMNVVFHPHGWIRNDQMVELIDHAAETYGDSVKFLSFRECLALLRKHVLGDESLRAASGADNGFRLLDLNGDQQLDCVRILANGSLLTRLWSPGDNRWLESTLDVESSRIHFGIVGANRQVGFVAVSPGGLRAFVFTDDLWREFSLQINMTKLPDDWAELLRTPGALDAVRWRDIDGDGECELLLGQADKVLVLRRISTSWQPEPRGFPAHVRLPRAEEADCGLRWVDLDDDGRAECVFSNASRCAAYKFESWEAGWRTLLEHDRQGGDTGTTSIPPFIRPDGTNNGVWAHSGHLWWQNEDTARLPDKVDRLPFTTILTAGESAQRAAHDSNASTLPTAETVPAPQSDVADEAAAFPGPTEPGDAVATLRSSVNAKIELVAAEPLVVDPIAFDWSADGRLWVVEMRDYPEDIENGMPTRGRVRILSDTDGDGHYDKSEIFLDDLMFPTGIKVWRDGALVSGAPSIIFAADRDGDGRAEVKRELFTGFREGNQQHRINGMRWGVDGWLYLANGESGGNIRSFANDQTVALSGRDLRIDPDTGAMEAITGSAQYGRSRNDWGDWFGGNNSDPLYHYVLDDHYLRRNTHYAPPFLRRQVPDFPGPAPVFPASRTLPRFNDFDRANRFTSACSGLIVHNDEPTLFGAAGTMDTFVCEPVHNLIHRERMQRQDVSFRSHRLPEDEASEFLASTDNWFRPVMIRIGPDGALWVADMYRLVIEHPEWIPRRWQEQLDIRSGNDRGRIFRMVAAQGKFAKTLPRLDKLTLSELVERLGHPNRWQRDMAQQLILWRNDGDAIAPLREFITNNPSIPGRIQALYTLHRLSGLDTALLVREIQADDWRVARHAVALSEARLDSTPDLLTAISDRAPRAAPPLMLQIAYSLGAATSADAAELLAEIAIKSDAEPSIVAAAMSSLTKMNVDRVVDKVAIAAETGGHRDLLAEVLEQAIAIGDDATHARIGRLLCDPSKPWDTTWRFNAVDRYLSAYLRRDGTIANLPGEVRRQLKELAESARTAALGTSGDLVQRQSAIRLLRADINDSMDETRAILRTLIEPQQPPEIQRAAIDAIVSHFADSAIESFLPQWEGFSPRVQNLVLDRVLRQKQLTLELLRAAKSENLNLRLDARRRQQLLGSSDAAIAGLAKELFASATSETRDAIVAQYRPAAELSGDEKLGQQTFQRVCSTCHKIGDMGYMVGPDLTALSNKSVDFLLTAILDPNRAVESNYMDYIVETVEGRQLSGLLMSETANSVRLLGPDAKEAVVLRQDIEQLTSSSKSLMPEGLEKDITIEQMHGLLVYLRKFTPTRKQFAGNEPQVAPVRDDGSIRMLAMHAEIFGPTLVYEDRFRNLGFWSDSQDYAAWTLEVPTSGVYNVTIEYACPPDAAGNRYALVCESEQLTGETRSTGSWDEYDWVDCGQLRLPAGRTRVIVRPDGPVHEYLMDLHQVIFEKAE